MNAIANSTDKLAVSTPAEINYLAECRALASRKTKIGETFAGRRGKQSLFSAMCKQVKSLRSIDPREHLDSETVKEIEGAIALFWQSEAERILTYGEIKSATYDKPSFKVIDLEDGAKDADITLNAKLHAVRKPKDLAEYRLNALYLLAAAKKRMDYMLDHVAKFDREQMATQQNRIAILEMAANKTTEK